MTLHRACFMCVDEVETFMCDIKLGNAKINMLFYNVDVDVNGGNILPG